MKYYAQTLVSSPFSLPLLVLASSSGQIEDAGDLLPFIDVLESDVTTFCLFIDWGRPAASAVQLRIITPKMRNITW